VGQGLACAGIDSFGVSPQGFLDEGPPDTAIGSGTRTALSVMFIS